MLLPHKTHELARRLVASEADAAATSLHTEHATVRVYERLRQQLGAAVGVEGFQALASRALALARLDSPRFGAVQVTVNGALRGLGEVESRTDADEGGETGAILIAQLLGLFLALLGDATTMRLIEDLRPGAEIRTESAVSWTDTASLAPDESGIAAAFRDLLVESERLRS